MYNAVITIKETLMKTSGGESVTFANNAPAFFFDSISYYLNGKELDSVRNPGVVSTLRGYLCYTADDASHLHTAGWNYPNGSLRNDAKTSFGYFQ
ncbi:hypothetical protein JTB14_019739 [Gonioctena quinquepunctata]|nr:hypothetical protein JTB14_019739 [Gonioctena quinquepunctata]